MLLLLLVLMSVAVAAWVLAPLLTPEEAEDPAAGTEAAPELYLARERAYESIRDLDFDFHSGKLSEADYRELRDQLQREAVAAMRNLEESGRTGGAEEE